MAGAAFEYDLSELDIIQERLDSLAAADLDELKALLGAELETQTRRRIEEEKESPEGDAWEALS